MDGAAWRPLFEAGLAKLRKQTPAKVGDKTMMDAFVPAVEACAGCRSGPAHRRGVRTGRRGRRRRAPRATKDMQAKFGRARNLGDRASATSTPAPTSDLAVLRRVSATGCSTGDAIQAHDAVHDHVIKLTRHTPWQKRQDNLDAKDYGIGIPAEDDGFFLKGSTTSTGA